MDACRPNVFPEEEKLWEQKTVNKQTQAHTGRPEAEALDQLQDTS